jgi:hypothetical protein
MFFIDEYSFIVVSSTSPLVILFSEDSTSPLHVERGGGHFDFWSIDGVRF